MKTRSNNTIPLIESTELEKSDLIQLIENLRDTAKELKVIAKSVSDGNSGMDYHDYKQIMIMSDIVIKCSQELTTGNFNLPIEQATKDWAVEGCNRMGLTNFNVWLRQRIPLIGTTACDVEKLKYKQKYGQVIAVESIRGGVRNCHFQVQKRRNEMLHLNGMLI